MQLHPDFGRTLRQHIHSREECRARESYGLQKDSDYFQKTFSGDLIGDFKKSGLYFLETRLGNLVFYLRLIILVQIAQECSSTKSVSRLNLWLEKTQTPPALEMNRFALRLCGTPSLCIQLRSAAAFRTRLGRCMGTLTRT